ASPTPTSSPDEYTSYLYSSDPSPFFMLLEQLTSLLHRDKFPNLRYIRDMSEDSDALRRGRRRVVSPVFSSPPPSSFSSGQSLVTGMGMGSLRRFGSLRRSTSRNTLRSSPSPSAALPFPFTPVPVPGHARIVSFWKEVLERTRERGVYVEDTRGVNVTRRDLERWVMGVGVECGV
ncbi:hypothetical protein V5O48_018963, partial [Marasmius crinis-equi]